MFSYINYASKPDGIQPKKGIFDRPNLLAFQVYNKIKMDYNSEGFRRLFFTTLLDQIYFTLVQSLKLVIPTAMIVGLLLSLQTDIGLSILGKLENLGQIINVVIFREITPFFITIIITLRSMTAISSELATMKISREIEALDFMGISVYHTQILPRIIAGSVSFFCMSIYFLFFAVIGFSLGVKYFISVNTGSLIYYFIHTIEIHHIVFFLVKTFVIGALLSQLACYHGLSLEKASFEVPIVTLKAVVECFLYGIALQLIFSLSAYILFGGP